MVRCVLIKILNSVIISGFESRSYCMIDPSLISPIGKVLKQNQLNVPRRWDMLEMSAQNVEDAKKELKPQLL